MKAHRLAFAIAAFTVSAAISCTQETYPETSGIEMTFTATYEEDGDTRTVLGDNGSVLWSPGDEVSIFKGSKNISSKKGSKFVSQNTAPAKTVEFKGYLEGLGGLSTGEYYWAVYPYSEDNDISYFGEVDATLPATQTAVPGTFAEKCHPAVARSATTSLKFYAACGGLKFTVSRSDIKSVSIKGNDDEHLAGRYCVAFDDDGNPTVNSMGGASAENEVTLVAPDGGTFTPGESYFISLLPATLSKGITITLEATGQRGKIVSSKPQTIKRSVFGVIKNIDSKAQWQAVADVVDLGLSVKWASFNVGATKPEEYGNYFAWGETAQKSGYEWDSYKWCNGDNLSITKYCTSNHSGNWGGSGDPDNKFLLVPEDDASTANWGDGWRMPTEKEMNELVEDCSWTWTDNYSGTGVHGYIVSGKKSGYTGKSIFLPAAGRRNDINLIGDGSSGRYWTSNNLAYGDNAVALSLSSGSVSVGTSVRCIGFSVRPVRGEITYYSGSSSVWPQELEIEVGESYDLSIAAPEGKATDPRFFWDSSDPAVAEVSQTGVVTGKKAGTAVIRVYDFAGSNSWPCTVTVKAPMPKPELVDLGLSVKWASFNVGATEPSEYGNYYAWGETEPKTSYSWNTYELTYSNGNLRWYNWDSAYGDVDDRTSLRLSDDAAYAAYGGQWRTPTAAEWKELRENCTWTWVTNYNDRGTDGYLVTGKKSGYTGKSIFLPAAGSWKYSTRQDEETLGYYMSSSLDLDNPFNSSANYFNYASVLATSLYRYIGVPVRAVYGPDKPEYYHAYVDLGLPSELKWATCNIGADKPEDYGYYYAWGETEPKTDYSWSTYKFELGTDYNGPFSKYVTNSSYGTVDNKTVLDPEDDAAHVNWGGRWRMPTDDEWTELSTKCIWTWTTQNGVNGRLVTGPNGKSIFFPAAGFRYNTDLDNAGSYGIYWSSSLKSDYPYDAYGVYFYSDGVERGYGGRCYGQSVRPVSE